MSDESDWPGTIKVEANERMPEGEFALVSGDHVTIAIWQRADLRPVNYYFHPAVERNR